MARSSYGPHRAATWAVTQKPKPMPRVVRLGRPANDNYRQSSGRVRMLVIGLAGLLVTLVLLNWRIF